MLLAGYLVYGTALFLSIVFTECSVDLSDLVKKSCEEDANE